MTRRVAVAGVLAVCFTALLVGVIAYVLVAHDARASENRVLREAVSHPAAALAPRTTYTQLAQVRNARGVVVRQTTALQELGELPPLARGFSDILLRGHHLRVLTVKFRARARLSVAVSDAPARASLRRLRRDVVIAMLASALLVSLILIWITRRALGPVRETAAVADRIVSTGDLTARVPEPSGDDETAQLARSMNRMLDHLEDSDAALRRLVSDASHELRSPITTLRGNLDLLTDAALNPEDRHEALADTRAEAERLGYLVEELLTLARADTVTAAEPVDLMRLIEEAAAGAGARVASIPAELRGATVTGDPVALRAMVRNLVENADRYGGGGELSLSGDRRWLSITVVDHGPGVPADQREAIFARFRRGTNSVGQAGSGLGLAIVAATARSHGGSVSVEETPGGGATFTVRLPR